MRRIIQAIMRVTLAGPLLVILTGVAGAQDSALRSLDTGDMMRGWESVGRLDIDRGGFCTAALISEDLILTAAHCVYDDSGERIVPGSFTFHAGLRDGRAAATRAVIRTTPHPAYVHRGDRARRDAVGVDLAVLQLERPLRLPQVPPFTVGPVPLRGDPVAVVSYARTRANAASLQETCHVLEQVDGVIVLSCDADFGSSGAPVFWVADGIARIVAVVSAKGMAEDRAVSLASGVGGTLDAVLVAHRNGQVPLVSPGPRFTSSGSRNDTGAKFVRP